MIKNCVLDVVFTSPQCGTRWWNQEGEKRKCSQSTVFHTEPHNAITLEKYSADTYFPQLLLQQFMKENPKSMGSLSPPFQQIN